MTFFGRRHSRLTGNDVGTVIWKEVADAAARIALSVISTDEGRVVKQTDDSSLWVLDDYTGPTYTEITATGVAAVTSVYGRTGDVAATTSDYDASQVDNTPAGNIVATTVQAAIDELDAEKTPLTHTHVMSQVTDAGTAATEDTGTAVGDLPQLENVDGTPGMPAVDGSQLTGVAGGGSAITVEDDGTPLTTDVTLLNFAGAGVTVSEPVADEITITVAPGAAPIDTVFGRTGTVVAATSDYDAGQVDNTPAGSIAATDVQGAIDELDSEKAATGDSRFPTTDEKGALAGTGTPSGSNLYVTADTLAAKTHTLSDITDSGTAAALDEGNAIGEVVEVVDVGGSVAGLPVLDGRNLTGVSAASTLGVEDEGTPVSGGPHDTMNFIGSGVSAVDAGGGTVDVTIAAGAAPIDTVFGRTGTVVAVADDYTADEVTNVPAGDITATDVQAAINELDTDKAATAHTQAYATVDGVPTDTFLGRDAAGTGAAEALIPSVARTLLNVEDNSVAAGTSGDAYATSHEADPTAHDADEIVNVPSGGIAATDVQTALYELDTEKAAAAHSHTLSDVTDSGTAAAEDVGVAIGDVPQLENVDGGAGLPAVDGSQLTGVAGGGSAITVQDEGTPLTTDVTLFNFVGTGVTVTEPSADEVTVTVAAGAAPIDTVFGRTGTVVAVVDDYAASEVENDSGVLSGAGQVDGALDELESQIGSHTHTTIADVAQDRVLGRVTAGSGLSEELTGAQVAPLLDHTDLGAGVGTNTHVQLDTHVADTSTNPHGVSHDSILSGSLATLKNKISGELISEDSNEINTLTLEASPAAADLFIMERDSDGVKRAVEYQNITGDPDATLAAAVITDNELVRGDGGARGVQDSTGSTLSDAGDLVIANNITASNNLISLGDVVISGNIDMDAGGDIDLSVGGGSILMDTGATVDGVDVGAHAADGDIHSTLGVGNTAGKTAYETTGYYYHDTEAETYQRYTGSAWEDVGVNVDDSTLEVTTDLHVKDGGIDLDQMAPTSTALQVLRANAGNTALEFATAGAGDLLAANNLDDVASAATSRTNLDVPPNARAVNAGGGLTGTGTLAADITLDVGAGTGITVNANDIEVDEANVDHDNLSNSGGAQHRVINESTYALRDTNFPAANHDGEYFIATDPPHIMERSNSTNWIAIGYPVDDTTIEESGGEIQVKDDGITLAKMAGGTDGNLITYDTSGDPVYVATGTSTQVLTSNGAGAAPTFEDASGGGGPGVPGTTEVGEVTLYNDTDGDPLGRSSFRLDSAGAANGTRTLSGNAALCGGYINSSGGTDGEITATADGAVALGGVLDYTGGSVVGAINATADGALAGGLASAFTDEAKIQATARGAFVWGHTGTVAAGNTYLRASQPGAFAHGFVDAGALIQANGNGGMARGYATGVGSDIVSSGNGASATGYASGGYEITASGAGSFAHSYANAADCIASAAGAIQFGGGTNNIADCLQVGDTTDGVRLIAGGTTSTIDGSIWVDGSGNVIIRSGGSDITIA